MEVFINYLSRLEDNDYSYNIQNSSESARPFIANTKRIAEIMLDIHNGIIESKNNFIFIHSVVDSPIDMGPNEEIWKDIEGYEGLYQVSNFGRIKSLSRKFYTTNNGYVITKTKILKTGLSHNGYHLISISNKNKKRKTFRVNRLIALCFIPNPNNLPEVNHKDGNKNNNNASNLEWCTRSYNCKHAYKTGLHKGAWKDKFGKDNKASKRVHKINFKTDKILETYDSITIASEKTGIERTCINRVCNGSRNAKTAGGFKWRFADE